MGKRWNRSRQRRAEILADAALRGATLEEAANEAGVSAGTARRYANEYNITQLAQQTSSQAHAQAHAVQPQPSEPANGQAEENDQTNEDGQPNDHNGRHPIDALLEKPGYMSLRTMGKKAGISRQAVHGYLVRSGKHRIWERKKEYHNRYMEGRHRKEEQRKELVASLITTLREMIVRKAGERGWAYEMTERVIQGRANHVSDERRGKILAIFQIYERAVASGEQRGLEELATEAGASTMTVRNTLLEVGLKPLYGTRNFQRSDVPTERIIEAYEHGMNATDLSYFLGTTSRMVASRLKCAGYDHKHAHYIKKIGIHNLTYRIASRIYESYDANLEHKLGFTKQELAFLNDTSEAIAAYALDHRAQIAPVITRALKSFYPNRKIMRAYLTKSDSD